MSSSSRGLICSLLAFAVVAEVIPVAQAQPYQTPRHRHHVYARVVERRAGDIYVNKGTRSYLNPGPSPDYQSDLYFEDTKYPEYLLGPGIFQRLNTSPGQYN